MKLGELDRKITIRQLATSRSPLGDEVKTWSDLATNIWAKRIPVSGREFANATIEQRLTEKTQRYRIRYLAAARKNTQLQIVDLEDSQTYDVKHIAEIGRRVALELVGVVTGPT